MSAFDALIAEDGPFSTPHNIAIGANKVVRPQAISAVFDGSGAAGAFLPCATILSQDGRVISRTFPASLSVGQAAEVTYSPFVPAASAAAVAGPIVGGGIIATGALTHTFWFPLADTSGGFNEVIGQDLFQWLLCEYSLPAGTVLTGAALSVITAGTGTAPTNFQLGVATADLIVRAVTANINATPFGVGSHRVPFAVPFTMPADGPVYWVMATKDFYRTQPAKYAGKIVNANQGQPILGGAFVRRQGGATGSPGIIAVGDDLSQKQNQSSVNAQIWGAIY